MEADSEVGDEGYAESTATSYATSIASEIRNGVYKHGRLYTSYGRHFYGLPIDDEEQDRHDLQHYKFFLIREGRHFLAPIPDEPQRILDMGTGSGIWAIDVADKYPSARVIGVDLAPTQPNWVPPNCEFEILDVEAEWQHKPNSYDFIHGRELHLSIRDWPALISKCYEHLKPGGYLELATTVPLIGCDDNTMPPHSCYQQLADVFFEVADAMGADGHAPQKWKQQMTQRGFENVEEVAFKIPSNPWPKNKRLKDIGAFELVNFHSFAPPAFKRGWIDILKRNPDEIEVLLAHGMNEAKNRKIHSYIRFYNVFGRKPMKHPGK